jgi:pimeloyl-ACP methyl ester carboxylesterase
MVPRYEPVFATRKGYRRIYPDLPGAGETPAPASIIDMDTYTAALSAFIDEESAGQRVVLLGASWGAYFALAYTTLHRERVAGLALIVPGFGPDGNAVRPAPNVLVSDPGARDDVPEPLAKALSLAATVHTRSMIDSFMRDVAPGLQIADHAFLNKVFSTRASYHDELRNLRYPGPALVITGRQDAMCGYADAWRFTEQFPRATYAVLDRAGHALQIEQATLLQAHVAEWLSRVREASGERYDADR